jgi:hypothetical protein
LVQAISNSRATTAISATSGFANCRRKGVDSPAPAGSTVNLSWRITGLLLALDRSSRVHRKSTAISARAWSRETPGAILAISRRAPRLERLLGSILHFTASGTQMSG